MDHWNCRAGLLESACWRDRDILEKAGVRHIVLSKLKGKDREKRVDLLKADSNTCAPTYERHSGGNCKWEGYFLPPPGSWD